MGVFSKTKARQEAAKQRLAELPAEGEAGRKAKGAFSIWDVLDPLGIVDKLGGALGSGSGGEKAADDGHAFGGGDAGQGGATDLAPAIPDGTTGTTGLALRVAKPGLRDREQASLMDALEEGRQSAIGARSGLGARSRRPAGVV